MTLHAGVDMVEWAPPGAMPAGMNDAGDDGHQMGTAWRGQMLLFADNGKPAGFRPAGFPLN